MKTIITIFLLSIAISMCRSETKNISESNLAGNSINASITNQSVSPTNQSVSPDISAKLDFDTAIYRYTPVVNPNSFRRKTFTVNRDQAAVTIDDKDGKIVEQATVKLNKEQFKEISEAVNSGDFKKNVNPSKAMCVGGYTEELTFLKGKKQLLKGTIRSCDESGSLTGGAYALRTALKALFPKVEGLRYF